MDINPYLERMRKAESKQLKQQVWAAAFAAEFVRQLHIPGLGASPAFCFDAAHRAVKALEAVDDLAKEDLADEGN